MDINVTKEEMLAIRKIARSANKKGVQKRARLASHKANKENKQLKAAKKQHRKGADSVLVDTDFEPILRGINQKPISRHWELQNGR